MQESLIDLLRCPVTRSKLRIDVIKKKKKELDGQLADIIDEAILYADADWFYPVIKGIPRLTVEAVIDYETFMKQTMPDFINKRDALFVRYGTFINGVKKKNIRTKKSFTKQWKVFNPEKDKTWNADDKGMLERFFKEISENADTLEDKFIFDAGCGNGLLNSLLARQGINNIAMDFSNSIENAYENNRYAKVHFIQGDVQYPPIVFNYFDIVHSSGVLHHTNNTELSFSCLTPVVKTGGKFSVWLYQPRQDFIHNFFNAIRKVTSRFPLSFQYYFYMLTIFPASYIIKRIKGNKQNYREMIIDILDWFTPEFRWEHNHEEVATWYYKRQFTDIQVTTNHFFGFNIIGIKK